MTGMHQSPRPPFQARSFNPIEDWKGIFTMQGQCRSLLDFSDQVPVFRDNSALSVVRQEGALSAIERRR